MKITNELIDQLTPWLIFATACYMCFIVWNIAKDSKAGRYGTIWMFIGLCGGLVSYYAKVVIEFVINLFHFV